MYIDGPNMFVELINKKINKNILLLGDVHMNVEKQYECNNFDGVRIDKFLNKFFRKTKKKIDFYIEFSERQFEIINEKYTKYGNIYIELIRNLYIKNRNKYPNVNMSLVDVRDDFFYSLGTQKRFYDILDLLNTDPYHKTYITEVLSFLKNDMIEFIKLFDFKETYDIKSDTVFNSENKHFLNYYEELKNNYKNKKTKKIIHNMFKKIKHCFQKMYKSLLEFELKYNNYIEYKTKTNYFNNCYNNYDKSDNDTDFVCDIEHFNIVKYWLKMLHDIGFIYAKLMDINVIKKILESNSENIILYSGTTHTKFIINFLVKNLNYIIINHSSNKTSSDTLNNKIKKHKLHYVKELNIFNKTFPYLHNNKVNQCVNIENIKMLKN